MNHEAALQYMELIHATATVLRTQHLAAESHLTEQLAADYRSGGITTQAAYDAFERGKAAGLPGFCRRWNATMPHELQAGRIRYTALTHAPDTDGNWRGAHPFAEDARTPPHGTPVVYVLFDDDNQPCYVGSTQGFRLRLNQHRSDKRFSRWIAHPCPGREAAYLLEERLLREHKPYLNLKASR